MENKVFSVVLNDARDRKHVYLAFADSEENAIKMVEEWHGAEDIVWGPYGHGEVKIVGENIKGFVGHDNLGNDRDENGNPIIHPVRLVYNEDYD